MRINTTIVDEMEDEVAILNGLGLTQNEAKVYLLLARGGGMKATEIAAKSNLQRRAVYDALQQLGKKGMAGKSEVSGVAVFSPSPPSSLLSFLEEKRDSVEKLLPMLSRQFESEKKPGVSVMYGKAGLKTVLEDILALKADYSVYYGQLQIFDHIPKFFGIFNNKRKRLGINARYVLLDVPQARKRAKLIPNASFKFIDPSVLSPGVWWTYADRLVMFIFQREPITIMIRNAELAKTFQHTFDSEFSSKTKIYRGDEGMKAIMEQTLEHKETLFIGAGGQASERYTGYLRESYLPRAMKKGHKWMLVSNLRAMKTPLPSFPISEMRLLPKDWNYSPNVVWVFGNCVANVVWLDEPVAFLVEDKHISQAYRDYFWLLWKMSEKK